MTQPIASETKPAKPKCRYNKDFSSKKLNLGPNHRIGSNTLFLIGPTQNGQNQTGLLLSEFNRNHFKPNDKAE